MMRSVYADLTHMSVRSGVILTDKCALQCQRPDEAAGRGYAAISRSGLIARWFTSTISPRADDPAEAVRAAWRAPYPVQPQDVRAGEKGRRPRRQDGSGGVVSLAFLVTEHRRSALAIAAFAGSISGDERRLRKA